MATRKAPGLDATELPAISPAALFWLGIGTGLLAGYTEVTILGAQKIFLHRLTFTGASVIWLAPLVNAALFGALGGLLAIVARVRPRLIPATWALALLLSAGSLSLLIMVPRMHRGAHLVLALGVGVQGTRWLGRSAWTGLNRVPALARIMLALTLLLAFGFEGWHLVRERRSAAALSSAAKGKPNVLLIMLDTVRALNLSLYGYGRATTPALERWSHGGVVFERALSTAPWTLASHASVMTGRLPHELSVDWLAPLDATYPTLAERLQAEGYLTAGIVANTEYCSAETGLSRGFVHYEDYVPSLTRGLQSVSIGRLFMSSRVLRRLLGSEDIPGRKSAADINRAALRWLSDAGPRPFFMFLNYYDAHAPYLPAAPYAERFGPIAPRTNVRLSLSTRWDSTEIRLQENAYDASIAYLDAQLGELFDSLASRGVLENTLVVLTADHGEEFHEHGVMGHGNSLYYPSVHVPLVIALPGRVPGDRRVQAPVSLRDVPATILDLVGLPDNRPFPGRTLARFWSAGSTAPMPGDSIISEIRFAPGLLPHYAVARGDMQSVLFENHRYIHNLGDGHEEIYDIDADPGEREDLVNTGQGRELLPKLRQVMESIAPSSAGATR